MTLRRWTIEVVWPEGDRQPGVRSGYWTRRGAQSHATEMDFYRVVMRGSWRFEVVRRP